MNKVVLIQYGDSFAKEYKRLAKQYKSLPNDFKKLIGTILNMIDTDKLIDELIIKMPSADM